MTGWDAMSCVCGMAFLCGSTLVKVGTVVIIWPQLFKSDVKPQQTNTWSGWPVVIKDDWGMLGRALAKVKPRPTIREILLTKLQIQWAQIGQQAIQNLFRSMRTLHECTTKRDGHPHYWYHFCHLDLSFYLFYKQNEINVNIPKYSPV